MKEYATEVDVEFVRKAVRAIGRCAIKLEKAAEKCIKVLLELIQTKVNYVVQEAIIVIKVYSVSFSILRLCSVTLSAYRIFSESIPIAMKALSLHSVKTSILLMSPKQRLL